MLRCCSLLLSSSFFSSPVSIPPFISLSLPHPMYLRHNQCAYATNTRINPAYWIKPVSVLSSLNAISCECLSLFVGWQFFFYIYHRFQMNFRHYENINLDNLLTLTQMHYSLLWFYEINRSPFLFLWQCHPVLYTVHCKYCICEASFF